jgi:hypothetical protein
MTVRDWRWVARRVASAAGCQCPGAVLRLAAGPRGVAWSRADLVVQVHGVIEVVPGKAGESGFPAYLLGEPGMKAERPESGSARLGQA